jgi:hypothetical protein
LGPQQSSGEDDPLQSGASFAPRFRYALFLIEESMNTRSHKREMFERLELRKTCVKLEQVFLKVTISV